MKYDGSSTAVAECRRKFRELHMVLCSASSWYISQEKWVGSEFACFVTLSIVFFECYSFSCFYVLWTSKSQKHFGDFTPWAPTRAPVGDLQHSPDPQLLFVICAFHAHIIWAPSALPILTFFSVLTPAYTHTYIHTHLFKFKVLQQSKFSKILHERGQGPKFERILYLNFV